MKVCGYTFCEGESVYETIILDKVYILCKDCAKGLQSFINEQLHPGKMKEQDVTVPWINIPWSPQYDKLYPPSEYGSIGSIDITKYFYTNSSDTVDNNTLGQITLGNNVK